MSLHDGVIAIVEVGAGLAAAVLLRVVLGRLERRARRTPWFADDVIFALLRFIIPWSAALSGIWLAALALPLTRGWHHDVDKAGVALVIFIATVGAARVAAEGVRAGALAHSGISGSASIFVNITRVVVLALGLLVLLNSLGMSITPLLTALGVGGLAVALALQDTLTNLFAGIHILASHKVQPGDFIQLDSGQQGYVVDTNWRNTTIRELPNNLVIVPNATLAATVMINYHQPEQEMSVIVQVGVSYDSDLEHVERVTIEVGRDVMRTVAGAVPSYEPLIRYHTFGNSSIDFSVILRSSEASSQYLIVHEFIKRLHRRYQAEGIEIPFPIRTIVRAREPGGDLSEPPVPAPSPEPALRE